MSVALRFHPAATAELRAASEYYEEQAPGLGIDFLDTVDAALELIRALPRAGHADDQSMRRSYLPRFPFTIVYQLNPDGVYIWAFAHQRREPGYWTNRNAP